MKCIFIFLFIFCSCTKNMESDIFKDMINFKHLKTALFNHNYKKKIDHSFFNEYYEKKNFTKVIKTSNFFVINGLRIEKFQVFLKKKSLNFNLKKEYINKFYESFSDPFLFEKGSWNLQILIYNPKETNNTSYNYGAILLINKRNNKILDAFIGNFKTDYKFVSKLFFVSRQRAVFGKGFEQFGKNEGNIGHLKESQINTLIEIYKLLFIRTLMYKYQLKIKSF